MVEGILTLIMLIISILAVLYYTEVFFDWLHEVVWGGAYPMITRVLMFLPWVIIGSLYIAIWAILKIWGGLNAIFLANAARDWWHNGKK